MTIDEALAQNRYETARRLCCAEMGAGRDTFALRERLHEALRRLGEIAQARAVLEAADAQNDAERQTVRRLLAEDFGLLASETFYRDSAQARAGRSLDEYLDEMRAQAAALAPAGSNAPHRAEEPPPAPVAPPVTETGTLTGILRFPDGAPAAQMELVLGLAADVQGRDPSTYLDDAIDYRPALSPQTQLSAWTDADGAFRFEAVPAGRHAFLAARLDPQVFDIATRFVAQDIVVVTSTVTHLDLTVTEWQSAPALAIASPFPKAWGPGSTRLVHTETWRNPFYFDFPRQPVTLPLPPGTDPARLIVLASDAPETPLPFQHTNEGLLLFAALPPVSEFAVAVYEAELALPPLAESLLRLTPDPEGCTATIATGRACFRVPWGRGTDLLPPLLAVQGEDDIWRGTGRFVLPPDVHILSRQTNVLETGPLRLTLEIIYTLSNGETYQIQWTAHADEATLLARETLPALDGAAFEFSLREWGAGSSTGGRGFLHWQPEGVSRHWSTFAADNRELARLQESVAWWIPPQGFGYALTPDALTETDYVGVFTLRRGEWIDREFARLCRGPGEGERRELDWPFPEMVGSTISMITAHTDKTGDAFFRFAFFNGERQWGILVSTLARNDGPWKEISSVQHKHSSPRLQDFKDWRLDAPDTTVRPSVLTRRDKLRVLRRKTQSPVFAPIWAKITHGSVPGPADSLRFAVEGDPAVAWRKKAELVGVAHIRARMTLLGRDFSDMYSPVGARPITGWAEDYDLIAASCVFTPDEERLVRSFLLLMGHLYQETDFMNWRYGSRNANFEADRADVVGAVGLCFRSNPDADAMLAHAAARMQDALDVYCTPGSGKWYENPACYYLQASRCWLTLAFHLWTHKLSDPAKIPRLRDFLLWGIHLLTPPLPESYAVLRDGTLDAGYADAVKVRRLPPIGDHAYLGPWVPEHYALASRLFRDTDPAFADSLLWAYQAGGSDGGYFGALPLLFAGLEENDLVPAPAPALVSRRLEGFGAILRDDFGTPQEFYLLLKQGPGGYRYHRTEGSFILFANGKPLVYDGGEGGETWRHSTLSFGDVHMPLAAGHVERFHALPGLEWVQGVHPVALRPGEPVFLSDNCHHTLVPLAHQRYAEPCPADIRSVVWVKNEYALIHDDLRLPTDVLSHWHLQVVADSETGDTAGGYTFAGRFGTDLQVLLPGQSFARAQVETLPLLEYQRLPPECFAMRHLSLTADRPDHYLAVLRPLAPGTAGVKAGALVQTGRTVGVHVQGEGVDDRIFFGRDALQWSGDGMAFTGRYGAMLRRPSFTEIVLIAGTRLEYGGVRVESDGPAVSLRLMPEGTITAAVEGSGTARIMGAGHTQTFHLTGKRETREWVRGNG